MDVERSDEPATKIPKQEIKEEKEDDTVLLKEVSDIPCELVKVKEEPITEDDSGLFKGPNRIIITPIKVKKEKVDNLYDENSGIGKENEIEALRSLEQECARIQSENSTSSTESVMDTILSPVDIQQQVQNAIQNKLQIASVSIAKPTSQNQTINQQVRDMLNTNDNALSLEPENTQTIDMALDELRKAGDELASAGPSKHNEFSAEPPGTASSKVFGKANSARDQTVSGTHMIVKQDLNDSSDDDDDEMDDSGEYMVLAEWTDGKLEEAGSTATDKENDKDKDQGATKRKLLSIV